MKHFQVAKHDVAASSIAVIATLLGLAATAASQAVNSIMLSTDNDKTPDFGNLFTDAIDNIRKARKTIEQTFVDFRKNGDSAIEAKDVDHVIDNLVAGGYLRANSPVVDAVMKQDLDTAFSKLDLLANVAVAKLTQARDSIKLDDSDTYLGYTVLLETAVSDMMSYARELQVIISATWREYNQMPSFVITDIAGTIEAKKTVAA